jgi:hypothetical protein
LSEKNAPAEFAGLILSFVRGKSSWQVLERAGIYIEHKNDGYEIDNPWQLVVTIFLRDMAQGLMVYRRSPDQLQRWAGIILAGSSFLDFSEEFETTPEGDILLNALWDAAFGDEISQEALSAMEGILKRTQTPGL